MKRFSDHMRVLFFFIFLTGSSVAFSQTFYAVANGPWSAASTWSNTQGGAPGAGVPGAGSTVYTDGFSVIVDQNVTLANLNVRNNTLNGIVHDGTGSTYTITITVALSGVNSSQSAASPTVSVIQDTPNLIFRLTGTATAGAIRAWSYNAPINRVVINAGSGTLYTNSVTGQLAVRESLHIVSGTFIPRQNVADASGASVLIVNAGTTLNLQHANITGDGTPNSVFNEVQILGTVHVRPGRFLNADNFSLNSGGVLNVLFSGIDQTQGWWYQNNAPSIISINPNTTVQYIANGSQNVYATAYGNLTLGGSGTITKTIAGPGNLLVAGNFRVSSSTITVTSSNSQPKSFEGNILMNGTWSSTELVTLQGGVSQTISGSGSINFNGGLTSNKSGGSSVLLSTNIVIGNAFTITQGTFNIRSYLCSVSGTIVNNGFLTANSGESGGTLRITGLSTLSGSGGNNLTHLTVLAAGDILFNTSITLNGHLVNNGSIAFSSGTTVSFTGNIDQNISGNGFSAYNFFVNKAPRTLNNNSTVTLLESLTMAGGNLDADGSGGGSFILNSDENGSARIGPMSGGTSITGNVTFRRFFTNPATRWRDLAFPVTGVTRSTIASFFQINDFSFQRYHEPTLGNQNQGWVNALEENLNNHDGYTAFMFNTVPVTLSLTGPLLNNNNSLYTYQITYTDDPSQPPSEDGWNFVPNPYACPINWNSASGWTKSSGIDAVAAIWESSTNTYRYSNLDWDGIVAQGQSFWVHTIGPSLVLRSDENVKVGNSNPTFYRRRHEVISNDRLMVSLENEISRDVTLIQFRADATPEHDQAFDAFKLKNRIFNISSLTAQGHNMAVNSLPKSSCTNRVRLNITNIEAGSYRLVFDSLITFNGLDSLILYDNFTEQYVPLGEGAIYGFEVTANEASYGADRFELSFVFANTSTAHPVVSKEGRKLVSNVASGNQWYRNGEVLPNETGNILVPATAGTYHVVVTDGVCTAKSQYFFLERVPSRVYPNPAATAFNIEVSGLLDDTRAEIGSIQIYSMTGQLVLTEKFSHDDEVRTVKLVDVKPGEYIVTIVTGNSKIVANERLIVR